MQKIIQKVKDLGKVLSEFLRPQINRIPRRVMYIGAYLLVVALMVSVYYWRISARFPDTTGYSETKTTEAVVFGETEKSWEVQALLEERESIDGLDEEDTPGGELDERKVEDSPAQELEQQEPDGEEKELSEEGSTTGSACWPVEHEEIIREHNDLIRENLRQGELYRHHKGLDFAAPAGSNVYSPWDGVVQKIVPEDARYGNSLWIKHSAERKTFLGNLDSIQVVEGEEVVQGQQVATLGENNSCGEGTYLHLEIWENGQSINPFPYFN